MLCRLAHKIKFLSLLSRSSNAHPHEMLRKVLIRNYFLLEQGTKNRVGSAGAKKTPKINEPQQHASPRISQGYRELQIQHRNVF